MNKLKPKNRVISMDNNTDSTNNKDIILYTIKDVQEILGRSEKFVYELFRQPDFPCFTIGRCKYITQERFKEWIEIQTMLEHK